MEKYCHKARSDLLVSGGNRCLSGRLRNYRSAMNNQCRHLAPSYLLLQQKQFKIVAQSLANFKTCRQNFKKAEGYTRLLAINVKKT